MIFDHDMGDEHTDNVGLSETVYRRYYATCDLCGELCPARTERRVPLWAMADAFETAIICRSPECVDLAKRMYKVSANRVFARAFEDRDEFALRMFVEADA